jgi:LuxR family maltose regulon positive regulatory protein
MENTTVSPTRYTPPRLNDILSRENLFSFLDERWNRKLTIVSARAGQGKSTTVADYLFSTRKRSFFWYNLDTKDSSLPHLLASIMGFFINREAHGTTRPAAELDVRGFLLDCAPEEGAASIARFLSDEKVDDFALVFDNFQKVNGVEHVCRFFHLLAEALPLRFHLIILSRVQPALNLAKLRSEKEVTELSDRELEFGYQEIVSLFHDVYRVFPDESLLTGLHDRFAGWITAYIFILDKVFRQKPNDQRKTLEAVLANPLIPEIADFLQLEVMAEVPTELQEDVVRVSLLPSFDAADAEAAAGKNGEDLIAAMLSRNLFIHRLEETRETFAFHSLFAQFLRKKVTLMKERERNRLYASLGDHLAGSGRTDLAIDFFIRAGLYPQARDVFIELADPIITSIDMGRVRKLAELFPQEQIDADPYLIYYHDIATNLDRKSVV